MVFSNYASEDVLTRCNNSSCIRNYNVGRSLRSTVNNVYYIIVYDHIVFFRGNERALQPRFLLVFKKSLSLKN